MGTVVFYTDESGSTENFSEPLKAGTTPVFTLTSVALPLGLRSTTQHGISPATLSCAAGDFFVGAANEPWEL